MTSKQPSTAPQTGTLTMASLQPENQQLQSENKELRARVAALEPLQAQNEQLQSENHDLRARVAALEPLQAGEAALQPQAAADLQPQAVALLPLARRQRQRVGAAPRRMCPRTDRQQPAGAQAAGAQAAGASAASASAPQTNDGPPSSAAVRKMGVAAAVAVLEEHGEVARVAADACRRIADLAEEGDRQAALDAGALVAVQAASKAHRQVPDVIDAATDALRNRWADGERLCGDGGCPGSLWA
jgi:uncharacterized protein YigA (DUF484 family)